MSVLTVPNLLYDANMAPPAKRTAHMKLLAATCRTALNGTRLQTPQSCTSAYDAQDSRALVQERPVASSDSKK